MELGNIRSELAKLQEEIKDMERQKGASQIEGGRERVLIMERVESLSQLYLGGLEGLRADFCDVKFNCRDRIQEFENKWKEFQKHQPEESTFATKQVNESHHIQAIPCTMFQFSLQCVNTFNRFHLKTSDTESPTAFIYIYIYIYRGG